VTIYFYAYSDNRKGLESVRRSAALAKELQKEFEVYFMTTEFRSATYAKRVLGVKKAVGIEDFRNSANIAPRGSVLIYDSQEHNETIHQEMIEYFKTFFRITYNPNDKPKKGEYLISPYPLGENCIESILVDMEFFKPSKKEIERTLFFGDSDYERELEKFAPAIADLNFSLLEGFYFFVDVEEKVKNYFVEVYPSEEYIEVIKSSKLLLTTSLQTALEATASGDKVLFLDNKGKEKKILENIGIKILDFFSPLKIKQELDQIQPPDPSLLITKNVEKTAKIVKELIKSET